MKHILHMLLADRIKTKMNVLKISYRKQAHIRIGIFVENSIIKIWVCHCLPGTGSFLQSQLSIQFPAWLELRAHQALVILCPRIHIRMGNSHLVAEYES